MDNKKRHSACNISGKPKRNNSNNEERQEK